MRALITGATTPIGRALIASLLEDEATEEIIAVGAEPRREDTQDGRVRYERVDLSRERSVRRLLFGVCRELEIDTIIDMAAHRSPRARGRRAHALNVRATRLLLRLGERLPSVQRFVHRSYGEIYALGPSLPVILDEEHPLQIGPGTPQWILDRVEADLAVCARMGMSRVRIAVLRCAECLAPQTGSQLYDYLRAPVCFRPWGFDPMLNVISEEDMGSALHAAARSEAQGIFNVPGLDTLPLSEVIARFDRLDVPVPGPALWPLYAARRATVRMSFDYALTRDRFHFGGVMDGTRAEQVLGYTARTPIRWPLRMNVLARRGQDRSPHTLRGRLQHPD